MKGGEIFFTLSANESDRPQDLGAVFFRGKTAIWILEIVRGKNHILRHFEKIFVISARWTRDKIGCLMIFKVHGILLHGAMEAAGAGINPFFWFF
jgi:hypothetical protein